MSDDRDRTSDWRVIPWLLFGLVVLFGGIYAATHYWTADRVPRGTTVQGIEIGGMLPAAADRKLTEGLDGRAAEPLTVGANGERSTLRPTAAGFTVDVAATVARSRVASSWDPRGLWDWFAGGQDVDAVVTVDAASLDRAVASFADRVDEPAVEGAVTFAAGQAVPRYPTRGSVVDRVAAAAAIRRAFLHDTGPTDVVALRTRVAQPVVTKDAVSRAMDDFANPATAARVVVRLRGLGVALQPEDFTPALTMRAVGSELRPVLDGRLVLRALRPRMTALSRAPRNASISLVKGRPKVVPARDGVSFRPRDVTGGFLKVLSSPDRTLVVRSTPVPARVSTADLTRLRITEPVSSFTTHFPYAAYRNVNLPRAAQLLDGTILKPGETFSLNRTLGQRTAANGFTKGYIIADGVFAEDFGGGVSQVATTTFNAAFFAGLRDVEHKAHSFYISRYPVGREATVVWPGVDLRFEDTTPYGVLISASVDKATPHRRGAVHVTMYSTKYWDISTSTSPRYNPRPPRTRHLSGPGCVPNTGYDGFDIDVYRVFRRHGARQVDHRETMHTAYTASDTVDCS